MTRPFVDGSPPASRRSHRRGSSLETCLLDIPSSLDLVLKAGRLQQFLGHNYFHPNGLMYGAWFYRNGIARPFKQREDVDAISLFQLTRQGHSPDDWVNCEQSGLSAGLFLWSQSLRYLQTRQSQSLQFARKAFKSIEVLFKLGEAFDTPGFICHLQQWQPTVETSPDIYVCIMHGLWAYRAIADAPARKRISQMLHAMANWWLHHNYECVRGGVQWQLLPHHAPAMACLHDMAWRATEDQQHHSEASRLLEIAGEWPTWIDRNRKENIESRWPAACAGLEYDSSRRQHLLHLVDPGETWLTLTCANYFMEQNADHAGLLKHVIARHYRYCQFGLRDDLLAWFTIQVDLERDTWHPLRPQAGDRLGDNGMSGLCIGDCAARIADAAAIAYLQAPHLSPGAANLSLQMLNRLDGQRLCWLIDPAAQPGSNEWMHNILSAVTPSMTLLTYWRLRAIGLLQS